MFDFGVIDNLAKESPKEIAYIDESRVLTFADLNSYTRKIATVLEARGIKREQVVLVMLPPFHNWLFSLALHRMGVTVFSLFNLDALGAEIAADQYIGFEKHPQLDENRNIICDVNLEARIAEAQELEHFSGYSSAKSLARLFSTSGTTGSSRYISVTYGDLDFYVDRKGSADYFGVEPILSLYPFGAGQTLRAALKSLRSGKPYLSCAFLDWRLPKFVQEHHIRTIIGSPVQIAKFLDLQEQSGTELPEVQTLIMGGSRPTSQLISRIQSRLSCRIVNAYGSTEANNIASEVIENSLSSGLEINTSGVLQIVDEKDIPLTDGLVGRIRYRTPGMALEYFNNPEASQINFKEGFFYPGDYGYINTAGKLELKGRTDEVINLGGERISPHVIEEIVLAQLGVLDCAAFPIALNNGVEGAAVAIVTNDEYAEEYFKKALRAKSPAVVSEIFHVSQIKRNENGKILRDELRRQYALRNNQ